MCCIRLVDTLQIIDNCTAIVNQHRIEKQIANMFGYVLVRTAKD